MQRLGIRVPCEDLDPAGKRGRRLSVEMVPSSRWVGRAAGCPRRGRRRRGGHVVNTRLWPAAPLGQPRERGAVCEVPAAEGSTHVQNVVPSFPGSLRLKGQREEPHCDGARVADARDGQILRCAHADAGENVSRRACRVGGHWGIGRRDRWRRGRRRRGRRCRQRDGSPHIVPRVGCRRGAVVDAVVEDPAPAIVRRAALGALAVLDQGTVSVGEAECDAGLEGDGPLVCAWWVIAASTVWNAVLAAHAARPNQRCTRRRRRGRRRGRRRRGRWRGRRRGRRRRGRRRGWRRGYCALIHIKLLDVESSTAARQEEGDEAAAPRACVSEDA